MLAFVHRAVLWHQALQCGLCTGCLWALGGRKLRLGFQLAAPRAAVLTCQCSAVTGHSYAGFRVQGLCPGCVAQAVEVQHTPALLAHISLNPKP